jgi:hypothetical protein
MKQTSRKLSNLSESLQRRLNAYALAASAAGVGVLALARPVDAKIVYTPAHEHIRPNQRLALDLNHDNAVDFVFKDRFTSRTSQFEAYLLVSARRSGTGNEIVGFETSIFHTASAIGLSAGVRVGPKTRSFVRDGNLASCGVFEGSGGCRGFWQGGVAQYLGLKFQIDDQIHYGWARVRARGKGLKMIGQLTGYAYETIPNKAIITGKIKGPDVITLEPSGLGALAAGHRGRSQ